MDPGYYSWQSASATVSGRRIATVWKPGVPGFGQTDPAAILLAEQIPTHPQATALALHAGSGLVAVAAAESNIGQLIAADPNVVAVDAARRSLERVQAQAQVLASADARDAASAGGVDTVFLRLPKGKHRALLAIWSAYLVLKPGGRLYLAGAKQEGIKTYLRHMKDLFGNASGLVYRKGNRVAQATRTTTAQEIPPIFHSPWLAKDYVHAYTAEVAGLHVEIRSRPGIFAWDRLDEGSHALIRAMQIGAGDNVLDLGCGCGAVGATAARMGAGSVTMVDADIDSVRAGQATAIANHLDGCQVQPSDCASAVLDRRFDLVVTNPPFHQGRATDYNVGLQFVRDAAKVLVPGGRIYLVANRFLAYEEEMHRHFSTVETAYQDGRYKVLLGHK